ncbi:MAG: amino acid ABC transporter permease [Rhizobiales bacterium]|jgi:polar amino acid transport system permease protein|nr:amino acid ABC transporter permease [Hyphomicrobiales bacterium]
MTSSEQATGTLRATTGLQELRRRVHFDWLDLAVIMMIGWAIWWFVDRIDGTLKYRWDWSIIPRFLVKTDLKTGATVPNVLLEGLFTTLRLAVWGLLLAMLIGLVMGMARTSKRLFFRLIAGTYVMLVRNIPPLVFVFIVVFFVASQLLTPLGINNAIARMSPEAKFWMSILFGPPRLIENFLSGLVCLSLFAGAYVTEIVRAGIESVPRSQLEAGESLVLTRWEIMRFIVMPQALRKVLPPLAGQFIQMVKDSSLVSLVSVQELSFMAMDIQVSTQKVFEVLIFTGGLYFVICYGLSLLFGYLERRALAGGG